MRGAPGVVFGRDGELARVERFLSADSSRPAVLLIEGEAGIGKTTVWRAALDTAASRSLRVFAAQPTEQERLLSYAALTDLLGSVWDGLRDELPDPQQRALDVALLRVGGELAADPRTTATAFTSVLARLAAAGRVLVAVDDVQWLDAASAAVLAFAARRLPGGTRLLLAQRTEGEGEAPPLGLDRLGESVELERITVGPLSLAALYHVVHERLDAVPARPLLARIADVSGGNPFFAVELARASSASGSLTVPPTLSDLARQRVESLSPGAQAAVLAASALSRPTLEVVRAIQGEGDGTEEAIDEAAAAGIVDVDEATRIRFTHPLLATAVYTSASAERRRSLHRRLADAVHESEERARHLAASTDEPDEALAAEIEQGATAALRRGAPAAAAELFEAARAVTPAGDDPEPALRRLLGLARALHAAGDPARARSLREEAVAAAPPGRRRALAYVELHWSTWELASPTEARPLLELALDELGDDDDEGLSRELRSRLARYTVTVQPASAVRYAEAVLDEVDETAEPLNAARALIALFSGRILIGEGADPHLLDRAVALEASVGPPVDGVVLPWFIWIDDVERATARWRAQVEIAEALGDETDRAERFGVFARLLLQTGDWDGAAALLDEACGFVEQSGAAGPSTIALATRAYLDAQRGRTPEARVALQSLLEGASLSWWRALHLSSLAGAEFVAGDLTAAEGAWRRLDGDLDALGVREAPFDRSEPDRIEALVSLGELAQARAILRRLEWRGAALPRLWIDVTLPRARAVLAAAEGDLEGSLELLCSSDEARMERLPYELGRHLLFRGTVERRLKQKQASRDSLNRAREIFEALGATPWLERTDAELARGAARPAPTELSETERRIAELAASGLTNREIAQVAFVSPKTVEANLARVYRKLGIRSRAELGARMAKR